MDDRAGAFIACFHEAVHRGDAFGFVDPLVIQDGGHASIDAARRLLEAERFLDRMERLKARQGSLAPWVERRLAATLTRSREDAAQLAAAVLAVANELDEVGAVDLMFGSLGECLSRGGEVVVDDILSEGFGLVRDFVAERGFTNDLWDWAVGFVPRDGIVLGKEADRVRASRAEHASYMTRRNPTPIHRVDPAWFVDGGYKTFRITGPPEGEDAEISPYAMVVLSLTAVLDFYERRTAQSVLEGLPVFPTGVAPIVVIGVIALAALVVTALLGLLCAVGVLKGRVCEVALAVFLVAVFIVCVTGVAACVISSEEGEAPIG